MKMINGVMQLYVIFILCTGCVLNTTMESFETCDIVWLSVSMSENSFLFKINEHNAIQLISGNVIFDTETKEIFCGNNVKTKVFKPNSADMSQINSLLSKIGVKEEDIPSPGNDSIDVFAYINEKLYWTPYQDRGNKNEELLELTKVLERVSSIQIGLNQ